MLTGLNHITIAVNNLERSLEFYTVLLGMKPQVCWDNGAYLTLGTLWLCLACDEAIPSQDYSHIAFDISESEFDKFQQKVRLVGIKEWKNNQSEGASIYIIDPDGHKLEIHSGSIENRLTSLKTKPYKGLFWY